MDVYTKSKVGKKKQKIFSQELDDASDDSTSSADRSLSEADRMSPSDVENNGDGYFGENDDEANSSQENGSAASKQRQMSVEYLENEVDLFQSVDDWDGTITSSIFLFKFTQCIACNVKFDRNS